MFGLFIYDTLCMLNTCMKFILKLIITILIMLSPLLIEALIF